MACLEMYNNSGPPHHQSSSTLPSLPPPSMSPRISFSNDFVESHNSHHQLLLNSSRSSEPANSDFEFSVSNYNMMSADELFFKGRILPFSFKDNTQNNNGGSNNNNTQMMQRTLRDQLLDDDEDDRNNGIGFSLKPPKSSSSSSSNGWKGFLGLRKSHIGSKKPNKNHDFSFDASKSFSYSLEDPNANSSQGMVGNEGPSSTDMEMGI